MRRCHSPQHDLFLPLPLPIFIAWRDLDVTMMPISNLAIVWAQFFLLFDQDRTGDPLAAMSESNQATAIMAAALRHWQEGGEAKL